MTSFIARFQQFSDIMPALRFAIEIALRASLILAIGGLVTTAMHRSSAAARHLVWSLSLAAALALIPLTILLPRMDMRVLPEATQQPAPVVVADSKPITTPETEVERLQRLANTIPFQTMNTQPNDDAQARLAEPVPAIAESGTRWIAGVIVAWMAGFAVVMSPLVCGVVRTRRIARRCTPMTGTEWNKLVADVSGRIGLTRRVTLLKGQEGEMPMTWGYLKHSVLIPAEADTWSPERRRVVLLHELSHVRRRDCLTQAIARLACAFHWFNPLVWLAARGLRVESEQACDDLVLSVGERPSVYAGHLLDIARSLRSSEGVSAAAVAMARPSRFEGRLRAILDATRNRRVPSRWLGAVSLVTILGISATLAAVRLESRASEDNVATGTVLDPDGKPIEGVTVAMLRTGKGWGRFNAPQPVEMLGKSFSDTEGRFRLEVKKPATDSEAEYLVVAFAPKYGLSGRQTIVPTGAIEEPIRLVPENPVDVKIVDLEGAPVPKAKVKLGGAYSSAGLAGFSKAIIETLEANGVTVMNWTTDAAGKFTIRGIGADYSVSLHSEAPGFGQQWLQLDLTAETKDATLSMGRAHILEGRVTLGKGGPPAVGAVIESQSMSQEYGTGMTLGRSTATTDADGRYRIEVAPGNSLRVVAMPPGIEAGPYLIRGRLVVPGTAVSHRVDFALPKGVLVRGRIVELGTGEPVAGAVVFHWAHKKNNPYYAKDDDANWFNHDEQRVVTAKDGRFAIAVMPGPGYLLANAPTSDYIQKEIPLMELYGETVWPNRRNYPEEFLKLSPKPADGPIDVDLTFQRGSTLQGEVRTADGQLAKDVVLLSRWYVPPSQMTLDQEPALPISGGRFELKGCDPAGSAQILLLDAVNQQGAVIEHKGNKLADGLKATLQPCGSATVRFVDAKKKPITDRAPGHIELVLTPGISQSELFAGPAKRNESPVVADSIFAANLDQQRYRDLKPDADGRMTFPTLIPGASYRVEVFNQPVKTQIEFTVKPGESKDLGELVITNIENAF
jgi:beta-lactamase regulating signal transducer with metallopeptidase domain